MGSTASTTAAHSPQQKVREAQRLRTRARVFDAAVAEIGRRGLAGADVAAIAAAAGVARGTFYFHFPTKEHVLVELERAEELAIVAKLRDPTADSTDLVSVLSSLAHQVVAVERRLGPLVFRDMLGLHFAPTGRSRTSWANTRWPNSSLRRSRRRSGRIGSHRMPTRVSWG